MDRISHTNIKITMLVYAEINKDKRIMRILIVCLTKVSYNNLTLIKFLLYKNSNYMD